MRRFPFSTRLLTEQRSAASFFFYNLYELVASRRSQTLHGQQNLVCRWKPRWGAGQSSDDRKLRRTCNDDKTCTAE